jgi:hypothetical protein
LGGIPRPLWPLLALQSPARLVAGQRALGLIRDSLARGTRAVACVVALCRHRLELRHIFAMSPADGCRNLGTYARQIKNYGKSNRRVGFFCAGEDDDE